MCHRMGRTVLHLAPHPDDELIGAPATLMALRDADYRIVNVACSLGRREQRSRREAELREACRRAGFELIIPEHPVAISKDDDHAEAYEQLAALARTTIEQLEPEIVVSPSPHDRQYGHELVARALRDTLSERVDSAPPWWMWGLWGLLPFTTIGTAFQRPRLEEILTALEAHTGELKRNDYRRFVRGRAEMNASVGPELLFGFGASAGATAYVELVGEAVLVKGRWLLGRSRWLEPDAPLADPSETEIGDWLYAESVTQRFGPPGAEGGQQDE